METDHHFWCDTNHIYFVHRIVWVSHAFSRKTYKGNRYKESIGCFCRNYRRKAIRRFLETCYTRCHHRIAFCMVGYEYVAGELSLSCKYKLVDVWFCGGHRFIDCTHDCKLPG